MKEPCAARLWVFLLVALVVWPFCVRAANPMAQMAAEPGAFSDADWIGMGGIPGTDGVVLATTVDAEGNLYIGGNFLMVGDVEARRVAKWDGSRWSALGLGFGSPVFTATFSQVTALAVAGTNLYAGGPLARADGTGLDVARWDGTNWIAICSSLGRPESGGTGISALAAMGNELFVGGRFSSVEGIPATNIAKWNGASWSAVGTGLNDSVRALAVIGSDLYAGGSFKNAGRVSANAVAKWDGSNWRALGDGVKDDPNRLSPASVEALAVSGSSLYAAGRFSFAGGAPAANIARWNGSTWSTLGVGLSGTTYAITVLGADVYAGGMFTSAGGTAAGLIAKWDGSSWAGLGGGVNGNVHALAAVGTNIFAGGAFTATGDTASRYLAIWTGSKWSTIGGGGGVSSSVNTLAGSGTNLFAGGRFVMAGGRVARNIGRWDGGAWGPLGSGVSGPNSDVTALAVAGSKLYVGGFFTNAGGLLATNIARWDGREWSTVGSGLGRRLGGSVSALVVSGNELYAGGSFTNAGDTLATRVARWDGTSWSALGAGLSRALAPSVGNVKALAVSGSDLYAGGDFDRAGGLSVTNIAKWDGAQWTALGNGVNNGVETLLVAGSDLYVGGHFTLAGGIEVHRLACWNGTAWQAVGNEISSDLYSVESLAFSGGYLYAGGTFRPHMFESTPNRIARWDGRNWSALGSGLDASVSAVLAWGEDLYVGGSFIKAGATISSRVARAKIGLAPGRFADMAASPSAGFRATFLDASVGQTYRLQASPSLALESWTDYTNFIYSGPVIVPAPAGGSGSKSFFRAVTP